ncbi:MAG: glycosyltransferase family 4 protein [Rhizobacter sp.]|nr:glycosyltransferase family 4 protein [Rhizobacter sp.]
MIYLVTCFLIGLLATLATMRVSMRYRHLSSDHDLQGPQKFHTRPVPRVGGAGILVAVLAGAVLAQVNHASPSSQLWLLIASSLPAFLAGIIEDFTKRVSPRRRLFATAISALIAIWLLDGIVARTHIPLLDPLLQVFYPAVVLLTVFIIAGITHAINIIDGFNGLASMCVLMMMLALAYVAFQVGDMFVFTGALITSGAILGFFVWNFPAGLIFLGDGGAYLLGFLLGELGILLVHRNPQVSPIFPLLLCAYPVFETVFTMYRRKFVRGVATGAPDGIHLHTLIHRRLIRWTLRDNLERRRLRRHNSMTSPYLWLLCMVSVIPSVLWWYSTPALTGFLLGFICLYVWLYSRIVRFKTPRWMVFRRTQ